VYVRKETQSFKVASTRIEQWVVFKRVEDVLRVMAIRLHITSMRLSDKGNCGKGYLKVIGTALKF